MKINYYFLWFYILSVSCDQDINNEDFDLECGQSSKLFIECFKDMSPTAHKALSSVKIPVSMDEINARCMIFERGMKCVDSYVTKCIDSSQKKYIDNKVYGAKQFYSKLCTNKPFQREYLRHKECYHHIHKDWDDCSREFNNILQDEVSKSQNDFNANLHFIQICCAKYGFENCVFNSAKYKCHKESAIFVREIAKIFSSEIQYTNCNRIDKRSVCSNSNKLQLNIFIILYGFVLYFLNLM